MKRKLLLLLAVLMIVGSMLLGCGSKTDSKYVGTTWTMTAVEAQGMKFEGDTLKDTMGTATIKFDAKKVTLSLAGADSEGTWSEKDDVITITADGESVDCPIEDSKLVVEMEGAKMYFEQDAE